METALILNKNNWANIRRQEKTTKVETTVEVIDDFIPKKIAALEVYTRLKISKIMAFEVIVSCLVVAVASALHPWAGAGSAGIFSILAAYALIKKIIPDMSDFESKYDISPK